MNQEKNERIWKNPCLVHSLMSGAYDSTELIDAIHLNLILGLTTDHPPRHPNRGQHTQIASMPLIHRVFYISVKCYVAC